MSKRAYPIPKFDMDDWPAYMNRLQTGYKQFSLDVMNHEGCWYKVKVQPRGRQLRFSFEKGVISPVFEAVIQDDVESYATATRKFLTDTFARSLCECCDQWLTEPNGPSQTFCKECAKYTVAKMTFEEGIECVICLEEPKIVRDMCGTCGQIICLYCWLRYEKRGVECPHCKSKCTSKRKRPDDCVSDSEEDGY